MEIDKNITPFPHCDNLVLHEPKVCTYCDMFPELQEERIKNNINFTGCSDPDKKKCPAEERRDISIINRWYGNVAKEKAEDLNIDYNRPSFEENIDYNKYYYGTSKKENK